MTLPPFVPTSTFTDFPDMRGPVNAHTAVFGALIAHASKQAQDVGIMATHSGRVEKPRKHVQGSTSCLYSESPRQAPITCAILSGVVRRRTPLPPQTPITDARHRRNKRRNPMDKKRQRLQISMSRSIWAQLSSRLIPRCLTRGVTSSAPI